MWWVGASGYILEMLMLERLMQELACGAVLHASLPNQAAALSSGDKREIRSDIRGGLFLVRGG